MECKNSGVRSDDGEIEHDIVDLEFGLYDVTGCMTQHRSERFGKI
jgi:hypothetical protein